MADSQAVKGTGLSTSANCPHFITTPGRAGSFAYHTHSLHPVPHSRVLTVKGTVNIFIVHSYSLCLSMPLISYVYKSLYLILWTLSRGRAGPHLQLVGLSVRHCCIYGLWTTDKDTHISLHGQIRLGICHTQCSPLSTDRPITSLWPNGWGRWSNDIPGKAG